LIDIDFDKHRCLIFYGLKRTKRNHSLKIKENLFTEIVSLNFYNDGY